MLKESDIKNVSLEKSAESVDFCTAWPAAKSGLGLLKSIVKNPVVKGMIMMIINVGDGLCPAK
jgi:hypothetical protein